MKELTSSSYQEHEKVVNTWYEKREITGTVMRLLQVIIANEDDDEEDPDSYWHP